ncbi:MAG: hypothetical protein E7539_05975 [Ruminococcaceae bacterium]|nr:hypothetical protein [Oscillospiraceae bacterium]
MKYAHDVITKLKDEYDCRLGEEQIISIINALEKRVALEILRNTEVLFYDLKEGQTVVDLDFYARNIVNVYLNDTKLKLSGALQDKGYHTKDKQLILDFNNPSGTLKIEHIAIPAPHTMLNYKMKILLLGEEHDEVYLYHVLSREALMDNDIDRLNNFSLLYAEAINSLKKEVEENRRAGMAFDINSQRFKKVW